jgi:hypothetical protein
MEKPRIERGNPCPNKVDLFPFSTAYCLPPFRPDDLPYPFSFLPFPVWGTSRTPAARAHHYTALGFMQIVCLCSIT